MNETKLRNGVYLRLVLADGGFGFRSLVMATRGRSQNRNEAAKSVTGFPSAMMSIYYCRDNGSLSRSRSRSAMYMKDANSGLRRINRE